MNKNSSCFLYTRSRCQSWSRSQSRPKTVRLSSTAFKFQKKMSNVNDIEFWISTFFFPGGAQKYEFVNIQTGRDKK